MRQFSLALLLAIGCTTQQAPSAAAGKAAVSGAQVTGTGLGGKVVETLEAPGYTYLRLTTPSGDVWAAIPTATVAVGRQVTLLNPTPMKNFTSKTLGRSFELIQFATGVSGAGEAAASDPASDSARVVAAHAVAPAAPIAAVKVDKAPGPNAKTVAEIHGQKAALNNNTVVVRGQVVKYTAGVLGKNWLHLRDGSGSDAAKDNDLVVTTADAAALGEIVTVTGPVHLDRDFGAGYFFAVIIEGAATAR